jgi:uncharacterized protein YceH (UPF0502 family)
VPFELDPVQARVLGALLEKDLATPEYYPLSLNALVSACNQKTNRDPVVSYDESDVRAALDSLRDLRLVAFVSGAGSRVEKYRHRLSELMNLTRGELAVLAVLLLRGPQTVGELKQRTPSMHPFEDLDIIDHTLQRLSEREPDPLAVQMPRLPGAREPRWSHLLSGEPVAPAALEFASPAEPGLRDRVAQLEATLSEVREELHLLRQEIDAIRRRLP